ncbi:MAG: potassium channel protein [Bacteroidota bacterium]
MTILLHRSMRRLGFASLLFVVSIIIGTTGFMLTEGYTVLDSAYMSIQIFSTVGFNEIEPLSSSGKVFSILYFTMNLGIFAYIVSVISSYLFEGELQKIFKNITSKREMEKLNDHIIVCGFGKNGAMAVRELIAAKKDFVVIERDGQVIEEVPEEKHIRFINGNAILDEVLIEAGIKRASTVITALREDSDNVFITLTARELNPNIKVIAKATEVTSEKKLYRAGAAHVVMPDYLGGVHMAHLITKPYVIEFLDLISGVGGSKLELEEVSYNDLKDNYKNKTLKDLDIRNVSGATVIGFKDDLKGFLFNPHSTKQISEGDVLILLGETEHIGKFKESYLK